MTAKLRHAGQCCHTVDHVMVAREVAEPLSRRHGPMLRTSLRAHLRFRDRQSDPLRPPSVLAGRCAKAWRAACAARSGGCRA
jgi:hypothetical protein